MKRLLALALTIILIMGAFSSVSGKETDGFTVEFEGVMSFKLPLDGRPETVTSKRISFYPAGGGWLSVSILVPPEELPSVRTLDNEREVLQLCIRKMSEDFDVVDVPRQDIVRTKTASFFHTQDVSYTTKEDYLIYSDGFMFWTSKGIVTLWFASRPGNNFDDDTAEFVLKTLQVLDSDDTSFAENANVFDSQELREFLAKEKLHIELAESKQEYRHLYGLPLDTPVKGEVTLLAHADFTTRDYMNNQKMRTLFSVIAFVEALILEERLFNTHDNYTQTYTCRKSNSVISSYMFSDSQVIIMDYNEMTKEASMVITAYSGLPSAYLEQQKSKKVLQSYYENDMDLWVETLSGITEEMEAENKSTDDRASSNTIAGKPTQKPAPTATPTPGKTTATFKETMDAYEAFFDEYIAFMEKYESSSDTLSMLADYSNFMTRYLEAMEKLGEIDTTKLSASDYKYYFEVLTRINRKLEKSLSD